ncbi:MAG: MFS transporter [Rubrobacter sp.]
MKPLSGRAFGRVFAGESLAMLADQMFFIALTLLVLQVAGPGLALGSVLAVASIPGAALMFFGGWLADRIPPATLLVFSNIGRALLTGAFALLILTDSILLWHLYVLAGMLGVLDALYYPASLAVIPKIARRENLGPANALVQGAKQVGGLVGPALAAAAVAIVGLGATFGAFTAMFAVAAIVILGAARLPQKEFIGVAERDKTDENPSTGGIVEGLRYVWRDPVTRVMVALFGAFSLAIVGPIIVGGAALAEARLGGAGALGAILSAFGAGSIIGLGVSSFTWARNGKRGVKMLVSLALFGVVLGVFGFSTGILTAVAIAVVWGILAGYLGVVMVTWIQERTNDAYTGRVMSLIMFFAIALEPASYAFAGFLLAVGIEAVFLAAGGIMVAAVVVGAFSRETRLF